MTKNNHLLAADILRAVAIVMVVIYHSFGGIYGFYLPWNGWIRDFSAPPSPTFMIWYPISFGWAGVSLFFVLSGFCIHLSFLRSAAFSVSRFFWARFWRIAPAYYTALLVFALFGHIHLFTFAGIKQFLLHLLFLQNLRDGYFFGFNPSFWSIATEVQLYLLFPLLLYIRSRYGISGCLVVTFGVGILWRIFAVSVWGLPDHLISPAFTSPFMTWFDWCLGAYVAERWVESRAGFTGRKMWVAILLPAFIISTLYKPLTMFSFLFASVISAVVLDWIICLKLPQGKIMGAVGFVGTVSYSIYLWHQPLLVRLSSLLGRYGDEGLPNILSVGVIIFIISFISYRIIERGGIFVGFALYPPQKKVLP